MLDRVVDRTGCVWVDLRWNDGVLESLATPHVIVRGARVPDPLFGEAHAIETALGERLTTISVIDWARPMEIPAIADPGKLPAGAGGAIMNALALLAEEAGVKALRYAGPYPTSALWKTLSRSFLAYGNEHEFTANLIERMATRAREPIPIDFVPAPHERLAIAGGHVELRDGIQRATIDGITYERGGSPSRLVDSELPGPPHEIVSELSRLARSSGFEDDSEGSGSSSIAARAGSSTVATGAGSRSVATAARAELWFGDARYAVVAKLTPDGRLRERFPIPPCESDVIGRSFPPQLAEALGELIAELVPAPLASQVEPWLAKRTIVWADLGARAARVRGDVVEVHAALWLHVAAHGLGRLALALAEAIAPVIVPALVRAVTSP